MFPRVGVDASLQRGGFFRIGVFSLVQDLGTERRGHCRRIGKYVCTREHKQRRGLETKTVQGCSRNTYIHTAIAEKETTTDDVYPQSIKAANKYQPVVTQHANQHILDISLLLMFDSRGQETLIRWRRRARARAPKLGP